MKQIGGECPNPHPERIRESIGEGKHEEKISHRYRALRFRSSGAREEKIVGAIKKIFYAADDNGSFLAKAQAMVSPHQKEAEFAEVPVERIGSNTQKGKGITNPEVDAAASTLSSPRQRTLDTSDVHSSESSLMTYRHPIFGCIPCW
ncbi:hypothetical protein BT93_I0494 [Corymbia citriodora subsp. variegata]|nr:hypothetical protein BT93_I0494 [Corymbia citriodora subsp. variegata]